MGAHKMGGGRGAKRGLARCALCLALCLLSACADPVLEPEALGRAVEKMETLPFVQGTVLDVTEKRLFLRTNDGPEYMFSLRGDELEDEDSSLQAGQQVTVFYQTERGAALSKRNSKSARVYLVQPESSALAETAPSA